MRTCPNCGTAISCGCQDRTATNGKLVCSNCIALYEQQIIAETLAIQNNIIDEKPTS